MTSTPHPFRLYPAIDLIDGRAVRLLHGQFDQLLTNELDDAQARAELVWAAGASALHVIDLDAARTGAPAEPNVSVLAALAAGKPTGAILQVGGGLRSAAAVEALLAQGVDRVLIGTMALRDPVTLRGLVERHGSKIAVALDSRQGTVRVSGWVGYSLMARFIPVPVPGVKSLILHRGFRSMAVWRIRGLAVTVLVMGVRHVPGDCACRITNWGLTIGCREGCARIWNAR